MAATQTEIISERRKEKKRAKARGEGDMVEGYDPVVPPPPNVAPPLPPEAEGYDPVVDPPRPVYKGFKSPPGMTADQRQRWQQAVDTRLSGKEDRTLERGKQDTEDLLSGIGEQAGKVYGDLDEMSTKALQYPVKFARDPMGESEKLSGTAIEMGKGLAQAAAAPLELSADITAGRTTPGAVEKQASDMAKRYARALSSGDIEETNKAIAELSAASSLADPTPASELVYAGSQFIDGNVADGIASLVAIFSLGGAGAYSIQEAKKAFKKGMTDKGMDAASAEKVADKAVEKAWLMRRPGSLSPEDARRKKSRMTSPEQQKADAAYGQGMAEAKTAREAAEARVSAENARQAQRYEQKKLELEAEAELDAQRKVEAEDVSDEPTVREPLVEDKKPLVEEDVTDMDTSPTPATLAGEAFEKGTSMRKAQEAFGGKPLTQAELAMLRLRRQAFKPPGETPPVRLASTEMGAPAAKPKAEAPKAEAPKAPKAPEAPKAEKPPTSEAPDLSKKTIKQLKAHAKSEGISLGSARKKADILRRIEKPGAGSAIAKARKEAQQPPKAKKAKKPDPEPGPAPKTRKVKVRTRGRDAPDDIERSGDVSKTATFVETEPVRGARTSVPLKVRSSNLTKSMSRYSDPKNQTTFVGRQAIADHATNLANQLEKLSEKDIRNSFDQIRRDLGVSRVGEGTGPTTAVVGGKKTALSGPGKILSTTGELGRRRGVKTKARVAERNLVAVETAFNEMAESAGIVKKSQSELDDVMKTMGVPGEEGIKPHIRLLEEYESKVKKYEELSGAFAKKFL